MTQHGPDDERERKRRKASDDTKSRPAHSQYINVVNVLWAHSSSSSLKNELIDNLILSVMLIYIFRSTINKYLLGNKTANEHLYNIL